MSVKSATSPPVLLACAMALVIASTAPTTATELSPVEELGKKMFFDASLSNPPGQSCAACHAPETGWTGPDSDTNSTVAIYHGVIDTRAGNRKPPTSAYAGSTPLLHKCNCGGNMNGGNCTCDGMGSDGMGSDGMGSGGMGSGGMGSGGMGSGGMGGGGMGGGMAGMMVDRTFAGGLFWDGRATGWLLGDPLAEQAMGPFLNPLEQNNPNAKHVCLSVLRTDYAVLFEEVWGQGSLDCVKDVNGTYEKIARSIAAYERSAEVNPFTSKFDTFWRNSVGKMPPVQNINTMNWTRFKGRGLTDMELQGLAVFNGKGKCSSCHWLTSGPGNTPPLFLDFAYHNLGVPKNPANPFYDMPRTWNPDGDNWIDLGLGGFLAKTTGMTDPSGNSRDYTADVAENIGRHRTPTLRNIDKRPSPDFVKTYGHNGYFKSIVEIVHFYNTRDTLPVCSGTGVPGMTCWPPPEVPENVNTTELGNLGLTPPEGMALITFLKTLSDGFQPE